MPKLTKSLLVVFGLVALLVAPGLAPARGPGGGPGDDQGDARRLRESGEIVPLKRILHRIKHQHRGRILDAELTRHGGRYLYEVEVLNHQGEVWELHFDARTGKLIQREKEH
jgi:uncharacterized membrane protein YkoI